MQYKLLALDIDGTLLNSQGQLTARSIDAIKSASQKGIKVCLVSGRRARTMAVFARALGLTDPMVCYNGGAITQPDSFQNLYSARIPRAQVLPIIQAWEEAGISVLAFRDSDQPPDAFVSGSQHWSGLLHYIAEEGENIRQVPSIITHTDWDPLRIFVQGDDQMTQLASSLADPLIDPALLRVVFTKHYNGSWYYEIYPAAASKSSGLRWLGQRFGIRQDEMVAVGDHFNDLDMIEYAGLGVAMGNAQPAVKEKADLVIGHHDQDGLAVFIEQQLLGGG